ncbi:MAG: hypothetical protein GZ088_16045 [Acidipila sp.]|nr:hypothetical protein [Acidipila sp.]
MKTEITLRNKSSRDVTVYLTLGATPGCLQDVSKVPWIDMVLSSLRGYFVLPAKKAVVAYAPDGMGFNGNFCFGGPPINCPTPQFHNGVNLVEWIINNAFQAGNPQETVNISCVAGVNAKVCVLLAEIAAKHGQVPPNPWNAGPSHPNVGEFENGPIGTNTGRVGVFPVGCDDCTASVSPPACTNSPTYERPQSNAICTVQRDADANGGLIIVEYYGIL